MECWSTPLETAVRSCWILAGTGTRCCLRIVCVSYPEHPKHAQWVTCPVSMQFPPSNRETITFSWSCISCHLTNKSNFVEQHKQILKSWESRRTAESWFNSLWICPHERFLSHWSYPFETFLISKHYTAKSHVQDLVKIDSSVHQWAIFSK